MTCFERIYIFLYIYSNIFGKNESSISPFRIQFFLLLSYYTIENLHPLSKAEYETESNQMDIFKDHEKKRISLQNRRLTNSSIL